MGNKQVTIQNLKIVEVDDTRDLLFVYGAIPGSDGSWVMIKDAVKKSAKDIGDLPYPAALKGAEKGAEIQAETPTQDTANEGGL